MLFSRAAIFVCSLVGVTLARRCPIGYTLYSNGDCIRFVTVNNFDRVDVVTALTFTECEKDGTFPPIIHSKEDENRLRNVYFNGFGAWDMILGAVCNPKTNKFQWADGSPFDYVTTIKADVNCAGQSLYLYAYTPAWYLVAPDTTWAYTGLCVKRFDSHMDPTCFDFEKWTDADNSTSCYQVSTDSADWSTAQSQCEDNAASLASIHSKEENEFVKNLSISKGYHTGVHIGAQMSGKSNSFDWIDGSEMDYDNFYNGFPMEGLGGCCAMDLSSGKWMNNECASKLPFVCKRDSEAITPACGSRTYKAGEIITPPGYPRTASEPCDYFLIVDQGKIVELEILLLEANACCDHLLIYNGQFESEPFADLTGSDREGEIFRTTSTVNIMRVSWQPQGAVNVRGFAMTFRAV